MQIDGHQIISAPRDVVWRALNDENVLKASIPGCKSLTRESETEMRGTVTVKIGVVGATFNGIVTLSEIATPSGYTISGEGTGGIAGFAKGWCKVHLVEAGKHTTELHYAAKSEVGGKLASIGARFLDGTARKIVAQFFDAFAIQVDVSTIREAVLMPPSDASLAPTIATGGRATSPGLPFTARSGG